jgi:hypothetical protein
VCASSGKNRQEVWRERLREFASKQEKKGDEWGLFLNLLGLEHGYYLAVCEVLKQGRWATAPYPRAYVKYAAKIEARKMHLSIPHEDDTFECWDSHLRFDGLFGLGRDEESETAQIAANKRAERAMFEDHERYEAIMADEEFEANKPMLPDDWLIRREPDALYVRAVEEFNRTQNERHIHIQPRYSLDWTRLAGESGLDQWETKVLEYRRNGVSRDRAMSEQADTDSRLAIQAAWKRMDRSGLKKVKELLNKIQLQDVPDKQSRNTRRMEAKGCPLGGRLKVTEGKVLLTVWKRTGGKSREDLGRFLSSYRAARNGRGPTQFAFSYLVKTIDSECPE